MTQTKNTLLQPLNVRKLSSLEYYQLGNRLLITVEASEQSFEDEQHLTNLFNNLTKSTKNYQKNLEGFIKSTMTSQLNEADKQRDSDFRSLANGLKAFNNSTRSNDKEAHNKLYSLLKQHREALTSNHEKASAHYSTLLSKLEQAPYKEAITTLGLTRLTSNLKESQENFEKLFKTSSEAKSKQTNGKSVSNARQDFHDNYQLLLDYIVVMNQVSTEPIYPKLLTIINQGRKFYSDSLAHRHGQDQLNTNTLKTNKTEKPLNE